MCKTNVMNTGGGIRAKDLNRSPKYNRYLQRLLSHLPLPCLHFFLHHTMLPLVPKKKPNVTSRFSKEMGTKEEKDTRRIIPARSVVTPIVRLWNRGWLLRWSQCCCWWLRVTLLRESLGRIGRRISTISSTLCT